jgi:hypothetical protein
MAKVMIVEDNERTLSTYKRMFGRRVGEENVDAFDNYESAVSELGNAYSVFVLDGEFPRSPGGYPEPLGVQLAQEIHKIEGSYDKVAMVSGNSSILKEAKEMGIDKIYSKGLPKEDAGERDSSELIADLKPLLQ